jgi:hypothetical protein
MPKHIASIPIKFMIFNIGYNISFDLLILSLSISILFIFENKLYDTSSIGAYMYLGTMLPILETKENSAVLF